VEVYDFFPGGGVLGEGDDETGGDHPAEGIATNGIRGRGAGGADFFEEFFEGVAIALPDAEFVRVGEELGGVDGLLVLLAFVIENPLRFGVFVGEVGFAFGLCINGGLGGVIRFFRGIEIEEFIAAVEEEQREEISAIRMMEGS
jgi:hypothetical protein